jgi:ferredoxin
MIAPDSFVLDDIEGHSSAVSEDVPPDQEDAVREAAHSCPEQAIFTTECTP